MTNGEGESAPTKIPWGTASLKPDGFSGIIRVSEIRKSEKSFDGKPPSDQLYWKIEPTSYEADEEKWPQAWYNISDSTRSKWAKLQERLEAMKCLPKNGVEDFLGLEIEFERVELTFGKDKEGNEIKTDRPVLMPKKLLRDTKKAGKTKGEASASSAPAAPVEKPTEKPAEEKIDLETIILNMVEKAPVVMADLYKKMNKEFGVSRTDVFRAASSLRNQGVVKLDSESQTLLKVEG